jgi:hypothetical protein
MIEKRRSDSIETTRRDAIDDAIAATDLARESVGRRLKRVEHQAV